MCGIVGYVGPKDAYDILIESLKKLEYRGYDSSGVALKTNDGIFIAKKKGRISELESDIMDVPTSHLGIAHTRWATHGAPKDENAHPHTDCTGTIAVVHNGIIENYRELKASLAQKGHKFTSETDTEVVAHLLEEYYQGDILSALFKILPLLKGAFALGIISLKEERILAVRQDSPLVIGLGSGENFLASDIPALLSHTKEFVIMENGQVADIRADHVDMYDFDGDDIPLKITHVDWDEAQAEKGGYDHFMIKEIMEQDQAIKNTLLGRVIDNHVILEELTPLQEKLQKTERIYITACGTAYHAGMVGAYLLRHMAGLDVEIEVASEFRYAKHHWHDNSIGLVISQSGETADTLQALRLMQADGIPVISVVNVLGSSVYREADASLLTQAGPEIAVASTKAYSTQLAVLYLFAIYMARLKGLLDNEAEKHILQELWNVPEKVRVVLNQAHTIREIAQDTYKTNDIFFIGRQLDYMLALEGSLKLKEISYIHSEAFPAGELKHGPLALVTSDTPTIAILMQEDIMEKTISNVSEVKARQGDVFVLAFERNKKALHDIGRWAFFVPDTLPLLGPLVGIPVLQLFAYYNAVLRGTDVDKPRNLAKSVTVE
ncbi:glutamine--fructose-6-phosphate transaminase (isomerizing) [Coprothermobacter platensis]|uniref:glutamine--fructose-6-phosphate transaminase (isomerizing) n=1 Tax=Coprothermobacter platensis TaxID=108819 RepID=UPI00036044C6|nr:glutamine--fructose-6-phosphate transaminase (isomerizing) [Coprothermobacter platensis]